jgi:hypothetical protein
LYELCEDESDHLIEDVDTIPKLMNDGSRICIEVGHLPTKYKPKKLWKGTDKIIKNGFWYVKMSDIKVG